MKKFLAWKGKWAVGAALLLGTAVLIFGIYVYSTAGRIGAGIGSTAGTLVGKAVGSFNGYMDGTEAGTSEGLNPTDEDVVATVKKYVEDCGRMELFTAGVSVKELLTLGKDYKRLSLIKADLVFSVDLTEAVVTEQDGKIHVAVPPVKVEAFPDMEQIKVLAEEEPGFFWSVSAEEAITAAFNAEALLYKNMEKSVAGYNNLLDEAEKEAETRVAELFSDMQVSSKPVAATVAKMAREVTPR